jgi:mannitol/fructose-specific phosphotransferase system IIA component (Ntr-type)
MMTLADYTAPDLIIPRLRSRDASSLTAELCTALEQQGRLNNRSAFLEAVIRRESLASTAMPPGWAIPHARLADIPRLSFALGRTPVPVSWFGGQPVSLIFLFAVPEAEAAAYLNLISGLARLNQDDARWARLASAPDGRSMFDVLQEASLARTRAVLAN